MADRRRKRNSRVHYGGVKTGDAGSASYSREAIFRNRAATDYMKIRGEGRTRSDHALHRIEQLSGGYCTIGVRVGVVKTGGGNEPALGCVNRVGSRECPALVPRRCPR
jgi:hypothetical protein